MMSLMNSGRPAVTGQATPFTLKAPEKILLIADKSHDHKYYGFAQVAQLVEHATENRGVGGSIPPLGTTSPGTLRLNY